jgi:hypothetical protein
MPRLAGLRRDSRAGRSFLARLAHCRPRCDARLAPRTVLRVRVPKTNLGQERRNSFVINLVWKGIRTPTPFPGLAFEACSRQYLVSPISFPITLTARPLVRRSDQVGDGQALDVRYPAPSDAVVI